MLRFGAEKLGLFCIFSLGLTAQQPEGWLSDVRVADLVRSGVSTNEIIRIISVAPKVQFDLRPVSTDALLKAGVSEEIIKAMAAKEMGTAPAMVTTQPVTTSTELSVRVPTKSVGSSTGSAPAPTKAPATVAPAPFNGPRISESSAGSSPIRPAAQVETSSPAVDGWNPGIGSTLGLLTDAQVNQAIQEGLRSRHSIGLRLNDVQTSMLTTVACHTCAQSGYTITVYTPEQWIELAARHAKREMLPFSVADVPYEMRRPMLHVVALPSTPEYLNGAGFSFASSVHRVVLSDTSRQITIQPLELSNGAVELNSALRSATFGTGAASFLMDDVGRLRAGDPKGEFFVVVVGDNQNKFFKVKAKYHKQLFGSR
jgi:hypothetical protein